MHHIVARCRFGMAGFLILGWICSASWAIGQDGVALAEAFRPGQAYKVDVQVKVNGKLAIPKGKEAPKVTAISGVSRLTYDERVLDPDEPETQKTIRAYREVEFRRIIDTNLQDAGIRPSVRRMTVIRGAHRPVPFSPDGALTWGEIDVVRTDVFSPSLVPGLLPAGLVKSGQTWKATAAAVTEITNLEKIDEGSLTVEFLGVAPVDGKPMARLRISGTVRGVDEDGPGRHKLEGTAFFDLQAKMLTYLSIRGTHELLDGANGQTMGVIEGQFVMTRSPLLKLPADLSDDSLRGVDLKPNAENTLLLFDDPSLGARFQYPRGWRMGVVQGNQVTLDHARLGGGILITVSPAGKVPTADAYLRETTAFLQTVKAQVRVVANPSQLRPGPIQIDRFTLDVTLDKDAARVEYAVLTQAEGGATIAARLPLATATDLRPDIERVIRSMSITRKIEAK